MYDDLSTSGKEFGFHEGCGGNGDDDGAVLREGAGGEDTGEPGVTAGGDEEG